MPIPVKVRMQLSYIEGLVDQKQLSELLEGLIAAKTHFASFSNHPANHLIGTISIGGINAVNTVGSLLTAILSGEAVVVIDGISEAIKVSISGGTRRSVEEPSSQTVVCGPKEGFTEELSTNMALVRQKLRTPDLRIENRTIGRYTQTKVAIIYIQGLANTEVLEELFSRLDTIDTDSVLESGYIEEFIQDKTFTPFPTIINTERPDAVAGNLLEGQVAVMVDGTPFVLILPVTFFKFFQSSEDYYQRYDISSFLRLIRLFSFFIALFLPRSTRAILKMPVFYILRIIMCLSSERKRLRKESARLLTFISGQPNPGNRYTYCLPQERLATC